MTRIIFVLLILLSLFISYSSSRRILHQPFFPVTDSPPPPPPPQPPVATQPPSLSPSHSPSPQPQHQPKHPFSSLTPLSPTHHHNHEVHDHRFFPSYTTPPTTTTTLPSTSLPTFPANISSIILPSSSPSKSHVSRKLLFLSLTLSILSIGFIAAVVASLLYHRNHNHTPPTSDSLRLFPANLLTSEKPPPLLPTLSPNFSTHSSEFLYLGTLVSPLHDLKTSTHITNVSASTSTVVYDRMGSPELRPLPPLPRKDVRHQHNPEVKENFFSSNGSPVTFQRDTTAAPPPPPPPPPPEPRGVCESQRNEEILKPKLKGLHWDKIKSSSEKAMVWDQLKSSSFQVNEEMIETLFMANSSKVAQNQPMANSMAMAAENNRVLDPHKARNIAILLRAFNLTIDEVCECILQGNVDTLGSELLESLLKMAPTNEEEARLKEFNYTELDPAEKFLKAVIDIPFAFKRVDAMLYMSNFDTEVEYYKGCFETIKLACEQLRNSRMFMKLLEAVLMAGNRMNIGTNRGDAHAFKLDTLLKLIDIKGTDGKTTLLHFVVQEIARAEGGFLGDNQQSELCDEVESMKRGLEVVSGLGGELSSVKKAASMDFDLLLKEVGRLAMGLTKISEVIALNEQCGLKEGFVDSMNMFLTKAQGGIGEIEDKGRVSISMVKETTEYFHGSLAVEEGQRLWIFMVVRDFLSVLDRVCKEVRKMNERTTVGSQSLPSVFTGFNRLQDFGWFDGEEPKMA